MVVLATSHLPLVRTEYPLLPGRIAVPPGPGCRTWSWRTGRGATAWCTAPRSGSRRCRSWCRPTRSTPTMPAPVSWRLHRRPVLDHGLFGGHGPGREVEQRVVGIGDVGLRLGLAECRGGAPPPQAAAVSESAAVTVRATARGARRRVRCQSSSTISPPFRPNIMGPPLRSVRRSPSGCQRLSVSPPPYLTFSSGTPVAPRRSRSAAAPRSASATSDSDGVIPNTDGGTTRSAPETAAWTTPAPRYQGGTNTSNRPRSTAAMTAAATRDAGTLRGQRRW